MEKRRKILYKIICDAIDDCQLMDTIVAFEGSSFEKCLELCAKHSDEDLIINNEYAIYFNDLKITRNVVVESQHKDLILFDLLREENNFVAQGLWSILSRLETPSCEYEEISDINVWLNVNGRPLENTDEEILGFIEYLKEYEELEFTLEEIKLLFKYGSY